MNDNDLVCFWKCNVFLVLVIYYKQNSKYVINLNFKFSHLSISLSGKEC